MFHAEFNIGPVFIGNGGQVDSDAGKVDVLSATQRAAIYDSAAQMVLGFGQHFEID